MSTSKPSDLSGKAWLRALKETKNALGNKDISMLAAGVAYFATLAFFPALAAFISIYALFVTPQQVLSLGNSLHHFVPAAMASLINNQMIAIVHASKSSLIGGAVAIALAIFSASSAVQNLIKALNRTFDVSERRKGIKLRLISLGFMVGFLLAAFALLGLLFLQTSFLTHLGFPRFIAEPIDILRWPLLVVVLTLVLATVYRYAPDRREAKWSIVSWGGAGATLIWILGTALFMVYATYFASFNKTYGIFAGLIILMSWLNLSAFIILLGAEVNHHLEEKIEPTKKLSGFNPLRLIGL